MARPRILRRIAAATALLAVAGTAPALAGTSAPAADEGSAGYELGYELGLEAYRYGLPLVTTERTFRHQTSST